MEETDAETTAAEEVEEPGSRLASSPEDLKELTHSPPVAVKEPQTAALPRASAVKELQACFREEAPGRCLEGALGRGRDGGTTGMSVQSVLLCPLPAGSHRSSV